MASTAIARRIEDIGQKTGAGDSDLARMLDTTPQTLYRWRKSQSEPNPIHLQRILDLHYVSDELAEFYEQNEARMWLFSPHKLLGGKRPVDLIGTDNFSQVVALVAQLRDGAFV